MMNPFTLTAGARADLLEIGRYTKVTWGKDQRRKYLKQLDDCFFNLSSTKLIGQPCDDICDGYRKYRTGSHVVYYRFLPSGLIEIVRVLHERMDVNAHVLM